MKKLLLAILPILAASYSFAQNTVWPSPTSNSNVGIGTTTANQKLTINGGGIGFDWNSTDKKLYSPADGDLEWVTQNGAGVHGFAVSSNGNRLVYFNTNGNSYLNGGNVGIGTTIPNGKLDVRGDIYWNNSAGQLSGDANGAIELGPLNSSGNVPYIDWHYGVGSIQDYNVRLMNSGDNQFIISTASNGTVFAVNGGNVGIGTTTPDQKLSVKGTIHSQQVLVDMNGWSDYVFKPSYKLASLSAVKRFIDQNHHLPDVPSEEQVKKEGIDLGEMNSKLLKKIEELTLYLIEENKSNQQLKSTVASLQSDVALLKQKAIKTSNK